MQHSPSERINMNAVSRCYLCDAEEFSVRTGEVRDAPALRILECQRCGLVSLNSLDHLPFLHYEHSGMHGRDPLSVEAWLRETDSDDNRRFELFSHWLTNKRVLNFGCGNGGFPA